MILECEVVALKRQILSVFDKYLKINKNKIAVFKKKFKFKYRLKTGKSYLRPKINFKRAEFNKYFIPILELVEELRNRQSANNDGTSDNKSNQQATVNFFF